MSYARIKLNSTMQNRTNLQKIHRISAIGIAIFTLAHIFNHLLAAHSIELHMVVMDKLRLVYDFLIIEVFLVLSILIQVFTGVQLYRKNRKYLKTRLAKLQAYSGLYLSFFLLAHTTATVGGNYFLPVDTNFYFGAMTVKDTALGFFFVPYYFLAVTAFFTHMGCIGGKFIAKRNGLKASYRFLYGCMVLGMIGAVVILLAFSGSLYSFDLPMEYQELYP